MKKLSMIFRLITMAVGSLVLVAGCSNSNSLRKDRFIRSMNSAIMDSSVISMDSIIEIQWDRMYVIYGTINFPKETVANMTDACCADIPEDNTALLFCQGHKIVDVIYLNQLDDPLVTVGNAVNNNVSYSERNMIRREDAIFVVKEKRRFDPSSRTKQWIALKCIHR